MTFPTNRTLCASIPSRTRLSSAPASVVNSRSASWSVSDPIDLFRHRPVEAPQAGFHVHHRHPELRSHQGAGEG